MATRSRNKDQFNSKCPTFNDKPKCFIELVRVNFLSTELTRAKNIRQFRQEYGLVDLSETSQGNINQQFVGWYSFQAPVESQSKRMLRKRLCTTYQLHLMRVKNTICYYLLSENLRIKFNVKTKVSNDTLKYNTPDMKSTV